MVLRKSLNGSKKKLDKSPQASNSARGKEKIVSHNDLQTPESIIRTRASVRKEKGKLVEECECLQP